MTGTPRKRDYAAEYARRKERLSRIGLTPYSARKRGSSVFGPVSQKQAMLSKFGVTEREFEAMRIRNRDYAEPRFDKWHTEDKAKRKRIGQAIAINTYNESKDIPNDWSEERVGYVTSFYRAIVDPRTNYESLLDSEGRRRRTRKGKPATNKWQAALLVKYSGIMELDEFEVRYGAIPE